MPLALQQADIPTYCDIRFASPHATFCVTFAQFGIVSGDGGSWGLPKLLGLSKAMEMTFTAAPIDASEALRIGLASAVAEGDNLMRDANALAHAIADILPMRSAWSSACCAMAGHIDLRVHMDMAAAFQAIAHASPEHLSAVERVLRRLRRV